jgi:hypothetical protein
MHFPLLKTIAKRVVFRKVLAIASLATFVTSSASFASAESLFERPAPSLAELSSLQHELHLASDATACGHVDARSVQRSVDQIVAMRRLNAIRQPETPESRNRYRDRDAFLRSIMKSKPKYVPIVTFHPMTPVEFATFRAAETAVRDGVPAAAAIRECPAQAQDALRKGANPLWQSCGSCPGGIPPQMRVASNSVNTNYSELLSTNGVPYAARGYTSGGTQIMAATYGSVTVSNIPGTSGPVPGTTVTLNLSGVSSHNATYTLPNPSYVRQSGWLPLPGDVYQGSQLQGYFNPTASTPYVEVPVTSSQSYEVAEVGAGDSETTFTANGSASVYTDFSSQADSLGSELMGLGSDAAGIGYTITTSGFPEIGEPLSIGGDVLTIIGAAVEYVFGGGGGGCGVMRGMNARSFAPGRPTPQCQSDGDDDY